MASMDYYERLRTEIVKSAVDDYKKALRKSKRVGCKCAEEVELERWFLSKYGQLLSGDNGEYIIEKCHETYKTTASKKGKQRVPDSVQKKVYAAYLRGESYQTIAERYGVSHTTMYNIVKRWEK